jgi:hypothetical protein
MYTIADKIQLIAAIVAIPLHMNGREDTSMHHAMDNNANHITRTFGFHCRENLLLSLSVLVQDIDGRARKMLQKTDN